ncbi:SEC59/DGK1/VTE5 family protein [bacterium]|nr:SEC59/DGK1/VTE5 family protein [bacterium]
MQSRDIRQAKREVLGQRRGLPHTIRRIYHLFMGLGCFALYAWGIDRKTACWLLILFGIPLLVFDIARLQSPWLRKFALKYFSPIMRRNELLSLSGNSFFILGMTGVVFFFSKNIALLSVLFLAVGDPVAAYVGTRYGKHRIPGGKSVEGALANFLVSALVTAPFAAFYLGLSGAPLVAMILAGGLVSTIAELIPFPGDDNFSVPLFSALLLSLLHVLWPFFPAA